MWANDNNYCRPGKGRHLSVTVIPEPHPSPRTYPRVITGRWWLIRVCIATLTAVSAHKLVLQYASNTYPLSQNLSRCDVDNGQRSCIMGSLGLSEKQIDR